MNSTTTPVFSDETQSSLGSQTIGSFGYGLAVSLAILILFVIITYASYKCKGPQSRTTTTINHRLSRDSFDINGIGEDTLSSYPHFTYSQLSRPNKNDSTASACSICLADYKDVDSLRLLPDCGHLFHISCIDPWLKLHPTCPICRSSPLPTPIRANQTVVN